MGRANVPVAIRVSPRLDGGDDGQNYLVHDDTDEEGAAAGQVGRDGAWVDAEDGDVGENGVSG